MDMGFHSPVSLLQRKNSAAKRSSCLDGIDFEVMANVIKLIQEVNPMLATSTNLAGLFY